MPSPTPAQFAEFVADIEPSLRRALADDFGPVAGREAAIDALAFAWANWDRVVAADDAAAYLLKVGATAADRHSPLATGDVTPILPRSQAGLDALVPPITADAAIGRADELVGGAPTTMQSRPAAPPTVVMTTPIAAPSAGGDAFATSRLPLPPTGPPVPPTRRTVPWVIAVVLVGVIALGGIALANRSGGDGGGSDTTSLLPTLPTTAAPATVPTSAPPPSAPATESSADTTTANTTPPDDGDDDDDGSDGTQPATTPATQPSGTVATTPPATDPPETTPPATDPPDTDPPATPPSTSPPSTSPPEATVPPRPTVPDG